MHTTSTVLRPEEATAPLWIGGAPRAWGDVVRQVASTTRTAEEAITAAGLDWLVEQHPMEAVIERGPEIERVCVPRVLANVRSDTGAVLGVVGAGYEPLQNRAALGLADALVDSGEAHWLGAGSTRGGARVHALMRLDRDVRIGGADGEDLLPLLLLRNGHDGGVAVSISVAPFRLVCLNGMLVPVEGCARTWRARHTAKLATRLGDARRTLAIAWRYYDGLRDLCDDLIRQPMGLGEFDRFLARLVPLPDPKPDATDGGRAVRNAERVREAIRVAYLTASDLEHLRGTAWGALQAVGEYHDHQAPVRRTAGRTIDEARFERAFAPARLKDRALELLTA